MKCAPIDMIIWIDRRISRYNIYTGVLMVKVFSHLKVHLKVQAFSNEVKISSKVVHNDFLYILQ